MRGLLVPPIWGRFDQICEAVRFRSGAREPKTPTSIGVTDVMEARVVAGQPARAVGSPTAAHAARAALDAILAEHPRALVAAMGDGGRLVPMPESLPLRGRRALHGRSGLDVIAPEDHLAVIEGWARAQDEPVVTLSVRLLAHPEERSALTFFDLRSEHGVHVVVLEDDEPEVVLQAADDHAARRRRVAHVKRDAVGVFLEIDEATTALLGWSPDELIGRSTLDFVHPDDVERAIDAWMGMRVGVDSGPTRVRYRHARGHDVWVEVVNESHLDDSDLGCVLSEIVDISHEMARLEALHDRERLLGRLAEALPIGICHLRLDREVLYSNAPLIELLGPVDSVESLVRSVAGADRRPFEIAIEQALSGRPGRLEVSVLRDFEEHRCELTLRTLTDDDGHADGVIVCAADVTDRSRLRSELEHRASHDALSGCLNRAATVTAIERALRDGQQLAVAYVDLDQFKGINDEFGHAAGDELLRVAAARLRSATRVQDRIGRIGGDEFVVVSPRGDGPFEAAALADRLADAICGDVTFAKQRIPLSASVGAAISLDGELDAEALLSRADHAMYEVKRRRRSQLRRLG